MIKIQWLFWPGAAWLLFLLAAYFIPITVDEGANYSVSGNLLGKIIFYSPAVLAAYLILGIALIVFAVRKKDIK